MADEVTLMIENEPLKCNKKFLIHHSDYFRAMFEGNFVERDMSVVILKDISLNAMQIIIKFLQHQSCEIGNDEILMVLQAACLLQFNTIKEHCLKILLRQLSTSCCLKFWFICEQLDLPFYLKAKYLSLTEFDAIKNTSGILELSFEQLITYLANTSLQCKSELDVFKAAMLWYYKNKDSYALNSHTIMKLLHCINFKRMSHSDILHIKALPDICKDETLTELLHCLSVMSNGVPQHIQNTEVAHQLNNLMNAEDCFRIFDCDPVFFVRHVPELIEKKTGELDSAVLEAEYIRLENIHELPIASLLILEKSRKFRKLLDIPAGQYIGYEGFHVESSRGKIFLFGGELTLGSGNWNLNLWVYDTLWESWERKTRLPAGRRHFDACICGPYLYIVGGTGAFRIIQHNMYWYNYKDNIWSTQLQLPCRSRESKCFNLNDQLALLNLEQKCVYLYQHEANKFEERPILDPHNLVSYYPSDYGVFIHDGLIFIKSATIITLKASGSEFVVVNHIMPEFMIDKDKFDTVDAVFSHNQIVTAYKCAAEGGHFHVELASLDGSDMETVLLPPEYDFDQSTKLFSLQHFRLAAEDTFLHDLSLIKNL